MTQGGGDGTRTNLDDAAARAESELAHALDDYFTALEAGRPIEVELLAALHPDVADRLRACIPILDAADGPSNGSDDERAGARLGDFILLQPIGRGGMGIVFEARQLSLRRRVAVKVLPRAAALDPLRLSRFLVEAQAAARLHHTNIVPVFWVGREGDVHYYAMQFIDGRTLADWLREARGGACAPRTIHAPAVEDLAATERASTPAGTASRSGDAPGKSVTASLLPSPSRGSAHHRWVATLGVQAADALEYAHRQGVVHRDVKPSNVMLDDRGVLWITDFGLARVAGDPGLTLAGDLLGTLRYMSPEQSFGDSSRVDHRSDVYSLGSTLYELLTFRPAREGNDRDALLAAIAFDEPRRPRSWDRSIPRDLETIVLRAMSHDRDARYQTAGAMADDLRRFLDHRPIRARRPSLMRRVDRWVRRHKPLAASLVFSLALAAVGGGVLLNLAARNRDLARVQRHDEYVRDVAQAGEYVHRDDLAAATALLSRHVPAPGDEDGRDFAWHYLWRVCNIRPRVLEGHKGDVYHVEYSPDGRTLATAGQDGTIRLWDADSLSPGRTFRGHVGDVDWVAFSPDGRRLASCGSDGSVRLWDVDDASTPPLVLARTDREVVSVVFTPDGRSVIWGGLAGLVVSIDLETRHSRELTSTAGKRINGMAVSPDGRRLGVGFDDKPGFLEIDLADSSVVLDPGSDVVNCVAYSADGRIIATGNKRGDLRTKPLNHGFTPFHSGPEGAAEGIAFSPDGRFLATCGSGGVIRLRDAATNNVMRMFRSQASRHWGLAFDPRGDRLVACESRGTVEVWDLNVVQEMLARKAVLAPGENIVPAWSSRSMTSAIVDGDAVRFHSWDFDAGEGASKSSVHAPGASRIVVSPDRNRAALWLSLDRRPIRLASLDGAADSPPLQFSVEPTVARDGRFEPRAMAFSADGSRFAACYDANGREMVGVWTVADGRPVTAPGPFSHGGAPAFSPDGLSLALTNPNDLGIWDLTNGDILHFVPPNLGWPNTTAWTWDGRRVAVGHDSGSIAVWDRDSPRAEPTILNVAPHMYSVAFSPDGRLLACAQHDGSTILLDVATGRPVLTLVDPPLLRSGSIQLQFSPDGSILSRLAHGDVRPPVLITWPSGPMREAPRRPLTSR